MKLNINSDSADPVNISRLFANLESYMICK